MRQFRSRKLADLIGRARNRRQPETPIRIANIQEAKTMASEPTRPKPTRSPEERRKLLQRISDEALRLAVALEDFERDEILPDAAFRFRYDIHRFRRAIGNPVKTIRRKNERREG